MRTAYLLVIVALLAVRCQDCSADAPANLLSVAADYDAATGPLDKSRVLNGSQGGYEAMVNRNWFPEAMPKLKAIGLRMIRLDQLLGDRIYKVVSRDKAGKIQCRFDRLDATILSITRAGMTPLMCLSYCPDALIPPGGNDASHPKSLVEWKEIVGQLVRHYRGLGHSGLYWEVWNEPDAKYFYGGSRKQYLELYLATVEAVRAADPSAKVGGAADANYQPATAQIGPLLDYVKAHPATPFDFMSYHWYGGCTRDEKPPYDLEWAIEQAAAMLKARGLTGREIFIDEWNTSYVMDAGPGADSDTNRTAAGVAARIYNALEHPEITKIFYFAPLEGYRPHRLVNGDLGLLTVNYHKKAVYNVFQMVNQLGDTRLKTTVGGPKTVGRPTYAMATKDTASGKAAVMLWNYADTPATVEISLDHLPWRKPQNLKVTQYRIDAEHANYYKDYQAGLRGYDVTPSEDLDPVECRVIEVTTSFTRVTTLPPFSLIEFVVEAAGPDVPLGVVALAKAQPTINPATINLAAGKAVIASSSLEKDGWGKKHLVDEITHSLPGALGWSSAGSPTADHAEWVGVDLGRLMTISNVKLYPRDDEKAEGSGLPSEYRLQTADDVSHWSDVAVEAGSRDRRQPAVFEFPGRSCRYVRVYVPRLPKAFSGRDEYGFQLAELQIYGKTPDSPAPSKQPPKVEIKGHNGAPTLFINGVPNAGLTYMTYNPQAKHYASFGKVGVDLASVSVTCDFTVFFNQPTAWPGSDQYDFSDMDRKMKLILEANPKAYVFPRVYMCSPPWWDEQHPDQLVKWEDGTTARKIGRKSTFPSWASEEYRQASAKNLRRFIEHVRKQWYADRVIGYHIASGMWEEWFYWSSTGSSDGLSDLVDYSEPMALAFQKWLKEKYASDAALQRAWNSDTATLATVQIPTKAERRATDLFVWRDPATRQKVIDFYRFYCENVTEIIKVLARTVKEATNDEQLVGVFYGYMFFAYADNWMQDNGHLALQKLLPCKDIDFLTAPSAYAFRELGTGYSTGEAATDAMRLHGKYYMNENDYRTHLVPKQEAYRRISTIKESESVQLRELGNMITHGWGGWWFDMGGGWYDEPEFMDIIKKLNEIGDKSIHFDRSGNAEIAVVVDEDSIFYTGLKKTLMLPLMYDQILPLGKLGAPFDWVFLNDIDAATAYKFYIFINPFHVTKQQKDAIQRLKSRGAKGLLWLYGAGFAGDKSLDVQGCTDVTGIRMKMENKAGPLFVRITDQGVRSLPSIAAATTYGTKKLIGPLLYPDDPQVEVLGTLEGHGVPGLVLKKVDGLDAYYSAAPTLPSSVLRAMAAKAGVHIYDRQDDVVYANSSFLSIHALAAGMRNIRLPKPTDVYDAYHDTVIAKNATGFDVDLPAKSTSLYFLGSEDAWKKIKHAR